jgi:hypothetical protein
MQTTSDNAPEVVVEDLGKAEERWRMATIGVLALTGFLCVCFSAVVVLNLTQSGAFQAGRAATATRVLAQFAATWTPTPTDTASPTAPARPTATGTDTATPTPTATDTPEFTATFTPRPPTNTPRPRPTNTPRPPPTNTPVPHPPTNTPVPPPTYALRVTQVKSAANCCSVGVFGTVRNNSGPIGGIGMRLIPHGSSTAFQVTTLGRYFGNANDRNYELSTHNGIGAGSYTLVAVDSSGNALSSSTPVNLCAAGSTHCPQWVEVDFQQN